MAFTDALPAFGADAIHQPSISANPIQIQRRDDEVKLFHYFRAEVAPQLAGLFDQDFWRHDLLRNTHSQPILWYACNAIAASHLLYRNQHGDTETISSPSDALLLQPFYQYQSALQRMRDLIALPFVTDTTKIDIILASQLFVILAMLRGDNMEMMAHYQNTCMLVGHWKTWAETRIHRRLDKHALHASDSLVYTCFRTDSLFLFMQPPSYKYHSFWEGCTLRLRDDPFISLTEAYFELEPIWNNVVKVAVHPGPEGPEFLNDGFEFTRGVIQHYKERLAKWGRKLAELKLRCKGASDKMALAILGLRATTIRLLLYNCALKISCLCWDACIGAFARLIHHAKLLIELRYAASEQSNTPSMTAALGGISGITGRSMILSPMTNETLYLVGRLCRDRVIRRKACALLAHDFYLTPSVHTLLYIHLADAQIRLEEAQWHAESEKTSKATDANTSSCSCNCELGHVCDACRVYETALSDLTATSAVLHFRTVDDYRHSRAWRITPLSFELQNRPLVQLSDI